MYTIWCGWDIGVDGKVFSTIDVAVKHAKYNLKACGIDDDFDELRRGGLIGFDEVEVINV